MSGPFYAAFVGGIAFPAFSTNTFGDVWGGSLETFGDVWGGTLIDQGDVAEDSNVINNLFNVENLIVGNTYFITGPGISANTDGSPSTTFIYRGGVSVTISVLATATQTQASLRITNSSQVTTVSNIGNTAQLVIGQTYGITGGGIQPGTTTTFEGGNTVTLSQPAISTNRLTKLTFSTETGTNVIKNLQSTSGLTVGRTYSVWGPGIPSNTFTTYEGGTSLTITTQATVTNVGVFLAITAGIQEDDGGAFDSSTMLVEDLNIFSLEIEHSEQSFPTLTLMVQNPEIGLLNNSNQLWLWLSWDPEFSNAPGYTVLPSNVVPLFHGRIVGIPERLTDEIVQLKFVATPTDFFVQKQALANELEVEPYWDPIWVQKRLSDPDTALETYTLRWHIDRLTLDVTTSDILNAEDGTITIQEEDHSYTDIDVTYRESPLASVTVSATVTWTQAGTGEVDLTQSLVSAFQEAGSDYPWPIVGSYTADGLLSSWPKPGTSFGGGWLMAPDSTAVDASTWAPLNYYNINYRAGGGTVQTSTLSSTAQSILESQAFAGLSPFHNPLAGALQFFNAATNWAVTLVEKPIQTTFTAQFTASRKRSEVLVFTLNAGVQSLLVDPNGSDTQVVELNSAFVDQPVDPGGALPIGDIRRNSYFVTDRGQQSLQYLLLYARAILAARCRAVEIQFQTPWQPLSGANVLGISCRQSVLLYDRRLPGGTASPALGKVVAYKFTATGDGSKDSQLATITIGCGVGLGDTLPTANPGTDSYATSYADGHTQPVPGTAQVDVVIGTLQYNNINGTFVIDDDGVDLFNMVPSTVVESISIFNGPRDQITAADNAAKLYGDPVGGLQAAATEVDVELVPVTGGDFYTQIPVQPANLSLPMMINLSAA